MASLAIASRKGQLTNRNAAHAHAKIAIDWQPKKRMVGRDAEAIELQRGMSKYVRVDKDHEMIARSCDVKDVIRAREDAAIDVRAGPC